MEHTVYFRRQPDYDQQAMDQAVEAFFAASPAAARLKDGMRVTIKPNLLAKHAPEKGVTTHPALVRAVIRAVKRRGVSAITVADSPGGVYTPAIMKSIGQVSGIAQVCQEEDAVFYTDCQFGPRSCQGELVHQFNLIKPVLEADFLIDLPKMKTHVMTTVTAGVKNLFGTIPGLQKAELHMRFPDKKRFGRMLTDLCCLLQPDLTILDAVTAMEGDGPAGGRPRQVGLLLASEDVWSLDLAVCTLMGVKPQRVPYLAAGIRAGLCPEVFDPQLARGDADALAPIAGYQLPSSYVQMDFSNRFPKPLRWAAPTVVKLAAPRPRIRRAKCIGCGKCAEICPQKTIHLQDKKARIDPAHCIRCFCCHEMCPVKAIDVYRPLGALFNL